MRLSVDQPYFQGGRSRPTRQGKARIMTNAAQTPFAKLSRAAHYAGLGLMSLAIVTFAAPSAMAESPPHTAAPSVAPVDLNAMPPLELGRAIAAQRCSNCHALAPGEASLAAPLTNLYGRKSGTAEGYTFSPNMIRLGVTWSESALDSWLTTTTFDTPDIRMRHVGIPEPRTRAALIAYINTLEGNKSAAQKP